LGAIVPSVGEAQALPVECSQDGGLISCVYTTDSTFTVPAGVTLLSSISATGGAGAPGATEPGYTAGGAGGAGDEVSLDGYATTAGVVLNVYVGGDGDETTGGMNGGGGGGGPENTDPGTTPRWLSGGGGGGASFVELNGDVIVAAAGGGGGGGGVLKGQGVSAGAGGRAGHAGGDNSTDPGTGGLPGTAAGPGQGALAELSGSDGFGGTALAGSGAGGGGGGVFGGAAGVVVAGGGGGYSAGYTPGAKPPSSSNTGTPQVVITYAEGGSDLAQGPSITASVRSAHAKRHGWYRSPVTVSFTCAEGPAPLVGSCPPPITLTASKRGRSITAKVADTNGNVGTVTVGPFKIDRTAPLLHVTGAITGFTYKHRQRLHCKATDKLSGVGSCKITHHKSIHRGVTTVHWKATAKDVAGNHTTKRGHYRIG
jgi:hypothetical protein